MRLNLWKALLIHRLHFAFTATFHYLFPQLTMGLALLIVVLKTIALRRNDPVYHEAARFWAKIFGINFVLGVVTGIPMEFQFGTNWSHFSRFAGGVIGQTLAMEGMFAFFLESALLGLLLFGEKRLSPEPTGGRPWRVFVGTWLVRIFHHCHRCVHAISGGLFHCADGSLQLASFWTFVLNPWAGWQYAHNMSGAVITGSFVMTAVGAFYLLSKQVDGARPHLRQDRSHRGLHLQCSPDFSHRRPPGQNGDRPPTRDPGRDGGTIQGPDRRASFNCRPA
jgi:cytochrome d ubiquinol oxidase subunit I